MGDLAAKLAASANALPQVKSGALKPFGGYRLAPREITFAAYARNRVLYEKIQKADTKAQAKAAAGRIGAGIVLISGCMDNQLSSDGEKNGLFTAMLEIVYDGGAYAQGYRRFHREIRGLMPPGADAQPVPDRAHHPGLPDAAAVHDLSLRRRPCCG